MSHPLVVHSPDLQQLVNEGFDLVVQGDHLVMRHVPYVTAAKEIAYGSLVSELSHDGTRTIAPGTHEIWFTGSVPCNKDGTELDIINQRTTTDFGSGVVGNFSFSRKILPGPRDYTDYHEKFTTYEKLVSAHARAIDPTAIAQTFPPFEIDEDQSVFKYLDAASSRAGIGAITERLAMNKIAIIGLGGTGGYVLDLVAKTPAKEIHLYDGDFFFAHNAFRSPGAASIDQLALRPHKVTYFASLYEPIRRGIVPHATYVTAENVHALSEMDFVFLAMDASSAKRTIVDQLTDAGVSFIDCGMGLTRNPTDQLAGIVRITTSTPGARDHVASRVSFADPPEDDYDWNIQTGDLNLINAGLAVVKWKKLCGFYVDRKREMNSMYTIASNQLTSGDLGS